MALLMMAVVIFSVLLAGGLVHVLMSCAVAIFDVADRSRRMEPAAGAMEAMNKLMQARDRRSRGE
jgi:energy-converting hydrogenase Eha subunit C